MHIFYVTATIPDRVEHVHATEGVTSNNCILLDFNKQ
jgi:hypothetical protein